MMENTSLACLRVILSVGTDTRSMRDRHEIDARSTRNAAAVKGFAAGRLGEDAIPVAVGRFGGGGIPVALAASAGLCLHARALRVG